MLSDPLLLVPNPGSISLDASSNPVDQPRLLLIFLIVSLMSGGLLTGLGHVTLMDTLQIVVQTSLHGL